MIFPFVSFAMQLLIFLNEDFSSEVLEKGRGTLKKYVYRESGIYNHSGDDGKEDPPVPIPNTEVKLFYAESTCG